MNIKVEKLDEENIEDIILLLVFILKMNLDKGVIKKEFLKSA